MNPPSSRHAAALADDAETQAFAVLVAAPPPALRHRVCCDVAQFASRLNFVAP